MNAITTADPTTNLSIDLGKYNSLACHSAQNISERLAFMWAAITRIG